MASSYKADETVQIDGHVIPKGTIIIGNLFSLGMNPEDFRIGFCDVPIFLPALVNQPFLTRNEVNHSYSNPNVTCKTASSRNTPE